MDCNKRQREKINGNIHHRCIHPEAPTKNEIVPLKVCEACPLANLIKAKPCAERKQEALVQRMMVSASHPPKPRPSPKGSNILPVLEASEYPECPFRSKGPIGNLCSITNLGVTPEICHRCDEMTKVEERENHAKLGTKVMNYFGAVRRWVASGRPTRSPEEVERLFNDHCKGCEKYDSDKHACNSCGCAVTEDGDPLTNKLAMATEHCPLGRF